MPELHLQDRTVKKYSACGLFTKHKQRTQKFMETGDLRNTYKNELDKTCLKNVTQVDTSRFPLKTNLASLKTEVDKLDIDKLVPVPNNLSKLTKEVQEYFTKKNEFNTLETKVDNINTTYFVKKTKYETDGVDLEKK